VRCDPSHLQIEPDRPSGAFGFVVSADSVKGG